ncbi:PREDICTED: cilia- and flagella-associated protein 36 isoform X2 [Crocodylus porosus]|uniref:cilia- and flagella-associated protein 36 isoform X2 n=1 Tax=Crocodylus porosus TaxID=8502 RepID=UPI00093E0A18|nr:PREDICTED: cilia- and flagella-associated protein 36 isoform X2 [Crocodylus porosus]
MAAEGEADWVVDSLAAFLRGPVWSGPVLEFMEQKCAVFDDEEESKLSYTEIHQEYKILVEKLLAGYLKEVGINEEKFQEACSSPLAKSHTSQVILQPVLAAEDFRLFKEMMVQKNIEMQLQAIRVIKERNGVLPGCLTDGSDIFTEIEQQEMKILREVLRRSKEEYEMEQDKKRTKESKEHDKSKSADVTYNRPGYSNEAAKVKESLENVERVDDFEEIAKLSLEETQKSTKEKLRPVQRPIREPEHPPELATTKVKEETKKKATGSCSENLTGEAGTEGLNLSELGVHELKQREDYLKQKRDVLMAMKKESRSNVQSPSNTDQKEEALSPKEEMSEEEKQRLLLKRRMLAAKLKEEVINKR